MAYVGTAWHLIPSVAPVKRLAMPDEVLAVREADALLKLAEKTVYTMAQAGGNPTFTIRGQWRIKRDEFDRWPDAQPRGGDAGGGAHGR